MTLVVADAADTNGRQPPGIVIINLGNSDIELIAYPTRDRLQHLPLALEGHIFRQTLANLGYTDVHITMKTLGISLEKLLP